MMTKKRIIQALAAGSMLAFGITGVNADSATQCPSPCDYATCVYGLNKCKCDWDDALKMHICVFNPAAVPLF